MNEEQIKARLMNMAREQKKTFNDLLKPLSFERLLARVGKSPWPGKMPTVNYDEHIIRGRMAYKQKDWKNLVIKLSGNKQAIELPLLKTTETNKLTKKIRDVSSSKNNFRYF